MILGKAVIKGLKPYQDRETGKDLTPATCTIYPVDGADFLEMAKYHNQQTVTMTLDEYTRLKSDDPFDVVAGKAFAKKVFNEALKIVEL